MSFPTRVVLGAGALAELPAEVKRVGGKRALVVADRGVVGAGLAKRLTDTLDRAGVPWALFDAVDPNPVERNVWEGLAAYKKADADVIVGIGGGSSLDVAKAVRLALNHPAPLSRYDDAAGGDRFVTNPVPPFIAIPTTAGTGSEVGRSAVIILDDTRRKTVLFAPRLLADCAILDPELTVGLPPFLTAATGFDALTHCIESYIAKGEHPLADAVAIDGVRRCGKYLLRAVRDGKDLVARQEMLVASMEGAIAFQKGLGASHALAHALGPVAGTHHGLSNALVLPEVLKFNVPAARDRLADVALALGGARDAEAAAAIVAQLRADCGLPGRLSESGIREEMLEELVARALEDASHRTNPRPCTADDFRALIRASL